MTAAERQELDYRRFCKVLRALRIEADLTEAELAEAISTSPGMVKTELNQSVWEAGQSQLPESERQDYESWAQDKIQQIAPLGRWQTPDEYGAMAVYLASDHARNITGQTLNIDGGQVMHS